MPKSLCRRYYSLLLKGVKFPENQRLGRCRKSCQFHHPKNIRSDLTAEFKRTLGCCYCGAVLITIVGGSSGRNYRWDKRDRENTPTFFLICGRTKRSMRKCLAKEN